MSTLRENQSSLSAALLWALDATRDPSMASADWLAADIDASSSGAVALLTDPGTSVAKLRQAKSAFKTMRIVGETSADRRVGARLYAAAIAAALVRHETRISRQSVGALRRAFRGLLDDRAMPEAVRRLAGSALCVLDTAGAPLAGGDRGPDDGAPA